VNLFKKYLFIFIMLVLPTDKYICSVEEDEFNKKTFLAQHGAHIARLRKSQGYSQDRLCLEAGFARGTLSRIEAGLVDPRASTMARIADTLGIQRKRFFEFPKEKSNAEYKIFKKF
jgi:DNA-binding XRE family transcriptional regulator